MSAQRSRSLSRSRSRSGRARVKVQVTSRLKVKVEVSGRGYLWLVAVGAGGTRTGLQGSKIPRFQGLAWPVGMEAFSLLHTWPAVDAGIPSYQSFSPSHRIIQICCQFLFISSHLTSSIPFTFFRLSFRPSHRQHDHHHPHVPKTPRHPQCVSTLGLPEWRSLVAKCAKRVVRDYTVSTTPVTVDQCGSVVDLISDEASRCDECLSISLHSSSARPPLCGPQPNLRTADIHSPFIASLLPATNERYPPHAFTNRCRPSDHLPSHPLSLPPPQRPGCAVVCNMRASVLPPPSAASGCGHLDTRPGRASSTHVRLSSILTFDRASCPAESATTAYGCRSCLAWVSTYPCPAIPPNRLR